MNKVYIYLLVIMSATAFSCKNHDDKPADTENGTTISVQRIVSLNGAVTEIISALGREKEIVGVDVTSTYPESVKQTAKDLGHVRSISIESILALKPTLILGTDKDISPELLEKLKAVKIQTELFHQEFSPEGSQKLIGDVAKAIGTAEGVARLQGDINISLKSVKPLAKPVKVLFIYARGANMLMVSGTGTPVDKMIALAGGTNAVTGFEDFKPLTPEALIKGNPDVILMFDSGLESVGGKEGILKIPGVDKTTAGKNKNIIAMDGALLSGFGPRTGEAASQLNKQLSGYAN